MTQGVLIMEKGALTRPQIGRSPLPNAGSDPIKIKTPVSQPARWIKAQYGL